MAAETKPRRRSALEPPGSAGCIQASAYGRGVSVRPSRALKRLWMIGDVESVREQFRDAARSIAMPLAINDWTEADARLALEGCPDGVILTDWDCTVDPDDSYLFLVRCPRVLICYTASLEAIGAEWLDRSNVELLPMPFELEDFEQAMAWLAGEDVEPGWTGSKTQLGMVLP